MTFPRTIMLAAAAAAALFAGRAGAVTIDFDAIAPGTPVTTIDGVAFTSNLPPGFDLIVSTGFDTTSGRNYLGVDDGFDEIFLGGDEVTLTFASPVISLSVSFVSVPGTPGEVFSIITSQGTALSGLLPDAVLGDGGEVFNVSFVSATPFDSAVLASEFGVVSYNIDDIVFEFAVATPAPGSVPLVAVGLLALVRGRRRLARG